jgi:hypothetical protein
MASSFCWRRWRRKSLALRRCLWQTSISTIALNSLGFGIDIYYMLGHLGWVQFSNRVSANTHKEFAL